MTGLVVAGFVAAGLAAFWLIVVRPRRLAIEEADTDRTIAWLRSMREVDDWPESPQGFDDHVDQALAVVADELEQRRLDRAVERHPAGGAR